MSPDLARRFLASLGLEASSELPQPLHQCPDTLRRAQAAQAVLKAQQPEKAESAQTQPAEES